MPRLRCVPEDFQVDEVPLYAPSGAGGHCWLLVEKRRRDTEEVAGELAALAGVDAGQVGWAGRKDREAVARQWLSVPGLEAMQAIGLAGAGWRVLRAAAHPERLRLGELIGNDFRLVVREVTATEADAASARLAELGRRGSPNRFGGQRFGHGGHNVELGARLLRGERVPGGRRLQRLYLSALQAAVFNETLRRRPVPPDELIDGDLVWVHATGALLSHRAGDRALAERLAQLEVSPTGPLIGHKMRLPRGEARALEQAACAALGVPWVTELPRLRGHLLPGGRRPLRVRIENAAAIAGTGTLELAFRLPPGAYATTLVEELFSSPLVEGPAAAVPPRGDEDPRAGAPPDGPRSS
jgi:tRNA pseudouridine13 synthase